MVDLGDEGDALCCGRGGSFRRERRAGGDISSLCFVRRGFLYILWQRAEKDQHFLFRWEIYDVIIKYRKSRNLENWNFFIHLFFLSMKCAVLHFYYLAFYSFHIFLCYKEYRKILGFL